jgi:hypothetical protein
MAQLFDARGNEFQGSLDAINGLTLTDARTAVTNLAAANSEVLVDINGKSTVTYDVRCVVSLGTNDLVIEGTIDGTNFVTLPFWVQQSTIVTLPAETVNVAISPTAMTAGQLCIVTASATGFRRIRMRKISATGNANVALRASAADFRIISQPQPTMLWVTATAAANTIATATLPAAGAGLFHYITSINLMRNATAALAGTATLIHTTTNLPGNPAWSVGNAMVAGGTQTDLSQAFPNPLKSSVANTNTTIVMPAAGAAVLNRINVGYYVGA